MRLDVKVSEFTYSRERAKNLIELGFVKVNGVICLKPSTKILPEAIIEVTGEVTKETSLVASEVPIEIVYEDDYLIIINKQAGVSTHPPSINGIDTIANGVLHLIKNLKGSRPGIVHRLDKETTGLLIIAKTEEAITKLSNLISERKVERRYEALCYNVPQLKTFQISNNVARDEKNRLKMKIVKTGGKTALTNVYLKENFANQFCKLELKLETGRTHQIRLHLQTANLDIIGDRVYGLKPPSFFNRFEPNLKKILEETKRQMLHAFYLKFTHPFLNKEMEFKILPPEDFIKLENFLTSIKN